ncbi:hypothetical protein JKF63_06018 [Porcisia hertigi]|uniref:Uncharacterized protein n=1 Tax=Porcisia hertigi TaxID=2761500 RepID=A0A836IWR1_9TRYP|nr:hypothetical protein JKF63_06018 [Porcisia hertigi]
MMYAFLPSSASRTEPLDWVMLFTKALAVTRAKPSEQVLNTLAMMQSYAAASPDLFTNASHGTRDVKEYVSLLCAADEAISSWPLRLRQLLDIPPVALVVSGGLGGSIVTAPVHTPRGEALILLFNVSLFHINAGLRYLARVRADVSAAITSNASRRLGGGGTIAAPNQNAKLAAQHCRLAVELLHWTEALHTNPSSPSALALHHLRSHIPLDVTRDMGMLCSTVAKYISALSSASTKDKPNVLAKLAYDAAQLPLPQSLSSSSSLQLLPSLLLAAYHYHKATWYYTLCKVPEMTEALGHIQYADTLLRTCDAQWGMEEAHTQREHESRQWWVWRLASVFTRSSWSRTSAENEPRAEPCRGNTGASRAPGAVSSNRAVDSDSPDTVTATLQPATEYPHLHELLLHGEGRSMSKAAKPASGKDDDGATAAVATEADVVQVYPYLRLLLQDVCGRLQQYQRENELVYFVKAMPADEVRRDVPDVSVATGGCQGGVPDVLEESALFEPRGSLFASLPSTTELQLALAQEEECGQAQQALASLLQRVERDQRKISLFIEPPSALQQILDALEPLLPQATQWGALDAIINAAAEAVEAAAQDFMNVAADWQTDYNTYVGAHCSEHPVVRDTRAELAVWSERAAAALQRWKALELPADVDSREAFLYALVPISRELHAYLAQSEDVCRDARDVLMNGPDSVTLDQVQECTVAMETVEQLGVELWGRVATAAPTLTLKSHTGGGVVGVTGDKEEVAPQYATAAVVLEEVLQILEEAHTVVAHMKSAAAKLMNMREKLVMKPRGIPSDVHLHSSSTKQPIEAPEGGRITVRTTAEDCGDPVKVADPTSRVVKATTRRSTATSSRKRTRTPSTEGQHLLSEPVDHDASDPVNHSRLSGLEEKADPGVESTTKATVSGSLLSRLKANKVRHQQSASDVSAMDTVALTKPSAKPSPSKRRRR